MDFFARLNNSGSSPLKCVDMHTAGMPTRVVVHGYPALPGTLLEQREIARSEYDFIRKRLLFEPRGHFDMFGAVLRPDTELTRCGKAHMGVLYLTGGGYSNMCGHATLALCRLLVDTHDNEIFPRRNSLIYDSASKMVDLVLHAPGGLIEAQVPTDSDGYWSDPLRPIQFKALPAYSIVTSLDVEIPTEYKWPQLHDRAKVTVSLAYCSAFSCQITLQELGFTDSTFKEEPVDVSSLKRAANLLKGAINSQQEYTKLLKVPQREGLGTVSGVMIMDKALGCAALGSQGAETGMYMFDGEHIDRSPTGSLAAARNAIAFSTGELTLGQSKTYHAIVSNRHGSVDDGFIATALQETEMEDGGGVFTKALISEIKGHAYYTGLYTAIIEAGDRIGQNGFILQC